MECFYVTILQLYMMSKVDEAGIKVADMEGETVDNKIRLDALKQLEVLIEEEQMEQEKLEKEEEKVLLANSRVCP